MLVPYPFHPWKASLSEHTTKVQKIFETTKYFINYFLNFLG